MKLLVNASRWICTSCRHKGTKSFQGQNVVKRKPNRSEKVLAKKFVDQRFMKLIAGSGGDGMSCFLRDKNSAFGGPDGGDGGKGGNVIFVADRNLSSLEKVNTRCIAEDGKSGMKYNMFGKYGKDLIINVPVGTFLHYEDSLQVLADFKQHGDTFLACVGGMGGKGNKFFASSTNTIPDTCTPGSPGETLDVVAELRTLANGGLVGYPNVGKSTLLRALTRATPKVGNYNFTTLVPHVGIIDYDDLVQVSIADTPGIIKDAHLNCGLGLQFLKHIQKCAFLMYVIDLSQPDPWDQLYSIQHEFSKFDFSLTERPSLVLANKIDLKDSQDCYELFCEEIGQVFPRENILPISGLEKHFLEELFCKIRELYDIHMENEKQNTSDTDSTEFLTMS